MMSVKIKLMLYLFIIKKHYICNMGLFTKKVGVTFIDKKWNRIKDNIKVDAIPRINELIYMGEGEDYYRTTQVIHWPSKNSKIYIVIESLSDIDGKQKKILDNYKKDDD